MQLRARCFLWVVRVEAHLVDDQERLTDQDKADKVPGCWLIIEAQGEKLKEAMQNLEGLCEHWGWELQDPNLIT